jgi:hypothetical protein
MTNEAAVIEVQCAHCGTQFRGSGHALTWAAAMACANSHQVKTYGFALELRPVSRIAVGHTSGGREMKALLFTGPFADGDVAELAATLRRIERRDPARHYNLAIADLDHQPSIEETIATLEKIFPRVPGQPGPDFWMKPL